MQNKSLSSQKDSGGTKQNHNISITVKKKFKHNDKRQYTVKKSLSTTTNGNILSYQRASRKHSTLMNAIIFRFANWAAGMK